jgi:hypothetical protein
MGSARAAGRGGDAREPLGMALLIQPPSSAAPAESAGRGGDARGRLARDAREGVFETRKRPPAVEKGEGGPSSALEGGPRSAWRSGWKRDGLGEVGSVLERRQAVLKELPSR